MLLFKKIMLILILLLLPLSSLQASERMSVVFLNPGDKGDAFFGMMTGFMQAAADDLGVDLEVIYCGRDHLKLREEGQKFLQRTEFPDYLILINEKNSVVDVLEKASAQGVKVALINEGLQLADRERLGEPGEILENWVLEYVPDEIQAGDLLASALINAAVEKGLQDNFGNLNMVGISGTFQTESSAGRVRGLRNVALRDDRIFLRQVVPAYWEEDRAREVAWGLFKRYPDIAIVWAASDLMALGALKAYRDAGGVDSRLVVGGIDWTSFALRMVDSGKFAATVGGHFMDGAWTLVMLNDHYNGKALAKSRYLSKYSLITKKNVKKYLAHFGEQKWDEIDFKQFSLKDAPSEMKYAFGLEAVMDQLQ